MAEDAWLRAAHVLGAVLLLGNVMVTGFWAAYLYRLRPTFPFGQVARAILWTDLCFTVVGGVMLVVSGILLMRVRGFVLAETPWLRHGIAALAASTALWLVLLLPDQWRMRRLPAADDGRLRRVFVRWSITGWAATGLLLYALWAMVTRS